MILSRLHNRKSISHNYGDIVYVILKECLGEDVDRQYTNILYHIRYYVIYHVILILPRNV